MRKPDLEIYEQVLGKLKVKPEEILFIDDQLENIEPAQKLGMHTVLAKEPGQIIADVEAILK
jgi:HAD superfamily hydrolase (TIGR01509 family)